MSSNTNSRESGEVFMKRTGVIFVPVFGKSIRFGIVRF